MISTVPIGKSASNPVGFVMVMVIVMTGRMKRTVIAVSLKYIYQLRIQNQGIWKSAGKNQKKRDFFFKKKKCDLCLKSKKV